MAIMLDEIHDSLRKSLQRVIYPLDIIRSNMGAQSSLARIQHAICHPSALELVRLALHIKGARTPPTQFFVDGCYARLLLLYTYRGFSTTTQGQSTCRRSRSLANLEEISGPGYKTLGHFFGAVR